jgi:hypothetical protein
MENAHERSAEYTVEIGRMQKTAIFRGAQINDTETKIEKS